MKKNNLVITNILGILSLATILYLGVFSVQYIGRKIEKDERANLLLRAGTIALSVDIHDLQKLEGSESDFEKPEYKKTKKLFEKIHTLNTDSRFVYIMGLREGKQFFYIDAEEPTSKNFSPPGQIYPDSNEKDIFNHTNGISYTKGPYTDSWGNWFSAYAPILDDEKNVLGLVGMDIDAEKLLLRISIVKYALASIFSLVFLSILLLFIVIKTNTKKSISNLT